MDANEKIKYQKSRYLVKKWESDFKKSKGFAPSKNDIKAAPRRVKDAYSSYWKLKAILLEASLLDATLDENAKDCFSLSVLEVGDSPLRSSSSITPNTTVIQPSQDSSVLLTSQESPQVQSSYSLTLLPPLANGSVKSCESATVPSIKDPPFPQPLTNPPVRKSCDQTDLSKHPQGGSLKRSPVKKSLENNGVVSDSVWGSHLSFKPNKSIRSLKERSVSFQYSEKLFAGSKFSKRNPRKPGSFKRNKTFDVLPDSSSVDTSCSGVNTSKVDLDISPVDIADRVVEVPVDHFKEKGNYEEEKDEAGVGHFNLLSEVQRVVIKEAPKIQYQGVSAVGALLNDKRPLCGINRKVDSGWLGRLDSDSGIASGSCPADMEGSSDELICDSDEESKSMFNLTSTSSVTRPEPTSSSTPFSRTCEFKQQQISSRTSLANKLPQSVTLSFTSKLGSEIPGLPNTSKRPTPDFTPYDSKAQADAAPPRAKRIKLESTPAAEADKARAVKKRQLLEKKVSSGSANNNFVRIDLKKKVYTKGKKGMNFTKYKKKQWKELKGLSSSGIIKCFKCGDVGHMAKQCKGVGDLLPYEECEEESIFPSLEEAAKAAADQQPVQKALPQPEEDHVDAVDPIYSLMEDGSLPDTPEEVFSCLRELGHEKFLPGQEEAIMSMLCGESCLVVMPTGSGKSLCYRLPALLYHRHRENALTLVVSPLVSLMEDQVLSSGSSNVGCLHHCQNEKQRNAVEKRLADKELSVLLVSPELLSSDSSLSLSSKLPPIALACIDEAHCLSHWSHNFRPSYLTLCQVLREKLKVKRLLGLTASVTAGTVNGVLDALGGEGVRLVRSTRFLPENLILSVSRDINREEALVRLLQGSRFSSCSSIIVYCTRREECARIAALLRTRIQREDGKKAVGGRKSRLSMDAEVYHAGLTPARRKQVQNAFMSGKVRIVVATVAFGMGLNKKDLRGVIHYNMPSSLENYLQEIGRSGRDGLTAHCHLFLSPSSTDESELKRHIYSSSVDRVTLRRLLELINSSKCCGCDKGLHEVAVPIDPAVEELDVSQAVISTLLAYLSATDLGYSLLPSAYTIARVGSYKGAAKLASLAAKCGVLGVGIAQARENGSKVTSSAEFNVIRLADTVSWKSGQVKRVLKQLEWARSDTDGWIKTGLNVEFVDLGFRLMIPCGLSADQQDAALDLIHKRALTHEQTALKQLHYLHNSLKAVSYGKVEDCSEDIDMRRCEKLAGFVNEYFTSPSALEGISVKEEEVECEAEVSSTIMSLVGCGEAREWTGRSVARILHGIPSPRYPALVWARTPYWRRHLDQDFTALITLASRILRSMR